MSEEVKPETPSNQELAADTLNKLTGYLSDARDVHARAALLPLNHPRYHPDNITAYHAWNHALETLDKYVKGGGFDEDWDEFTKAHTDARALSTKILNETNALHEASIDNEFRKLSSALSNIDKILGEKELVSSWN